jgi:hypothetical protein
MIRCEEIALKRLLFVQENPRTVPYTLFDLTEGGCEIEVGPLEDLDSEFEYEAARAVTSGGRIELYLVKILEGEGANKTRTWPFPMGSRTAHFVQGSII